jgi:PP-loop superfamily ATP-utilizing enzyme
VSTDPRLAAAERVLADHGVYGARVEVEGHEREIAALHVPEPTWARMMGPDGVRIADAVKAAGFRYVALDLAGPEKDRLTQRRGDTERTTQPLRDSASLRETLS